MLPSNESSSFFSSIFAPIVVPYPFFLSRSPLSPQYFSFLPPDPCRGLHLEHTIELLLLTLLLLWFLSLGLRWGTKEKRERGKAKSSWNERHWVWEFLNRWSDDVSLSLVLWTIDRRENHVVAHFYSWGAEAVLKSMTTREGRRRRHTHVGYSIFIYSIRAHTHTQHHRVEANIAPASAVIVMNEVSWDSLRLLGTVWGGVKGRVHHRSVQSATADVLLGNIYTPTRSSLLSNMFGLLRSIESPAGWLDSGLFCQIDHSICWNEKTF